MKIKKERPDVVWRKTWSRVKKGDLKRRCCGMMSESKYSAFRLIYFTGHKMNTLERLVRCSIPNLVKCSEIEKKKDKKNEQH